MATKKRAVKARGASRATAKKPRRATTTPSKTTSPDGISLGLPRIGAAWQGQGGAFMGIVRGAQGQPDYAIVLRVADTIKGSWGPASKVQGAQSDYDGLANTRAMAAAGSTIATSALAFRNGPHRDYYIAARHEARIIAANASGLLGKGWRWTSTQNAVSDVYAWLQNFEYGNQYYGHKSDSYGVVLVRRVPIQ